VKAWRNLCRKPLETVVLYLTECVIYMDWIAELIRNHVTNLNPDTVTVDVELLNG
jgi:hypothetical protein